MKNFYLFLLIALMAFIPENAFAQITDYSKEVSFLQGNGILDRDTMQFFEDMRNYGFENFNAFITHSQALSCIFMLIFFSIKSYEMMVGDKQMEIMPLLRPFGLLMVILWWGTFIKVVAYPTDLIARETEAMYGKEKDLINSLQFQRANYQIQIQDKLIDAAVEATISADQAVETEKTIGEMITDAASSMTDSFVESVLAPLLKVKARLQIGLQLLATQILELVAIWILRICVYLVFGIQIIYSTILIILGPFSVAVSILPAFRDAFSTWIARFISVNLYVGVAFLVLYVSALFQKLALSQEIKKYTELLDTSGGTDVLEKLTWFAGNGIMSFGMVIVMFIVSAVAITTVPSISTWIISTSGITSASATAARSASQLGSVATRIATKGMKG